MKPHEVFKIKMSAETIVRKTGIFSVGLNRMAKKPSLFANGRFVPALSLLLFNRWSWKSGKGGYLKIVFACPWLCYHKKSSTIRLNRTFYQFYTLQRNVFHESKEIVDPIFQGTLSQTILNKFIHKTDGGPNYCHILKPHATQKPIILYRSVHENVPIHGEKYRDHFLVKKEIVRLQTHSELPIFRRTAGINKNVLIEHGPRKNFEKQQAWGKQNQQTGIAQHLVSLKITTHHNIKNAFNEYHSLKDGFTTNTAITTGVRHSHFLTQPVLINFDKELKSKLTQQHSFVPEITVLRSIYERLININNSFNSEENRKQLFTVYAHELTCGFTHQTFLPFKIVSYNQVSSSVNSLISKTSAYDTFKVKQNLSNRWNHGMQAFSKKRSVLNVSSPTMHRLSSRMIAHTTFQFKRKHFLICQAIMPGTENLVNALRTSTFSLPSVDFDHIQAPFSNQIGKNNVVPETPSQITDIHSAKSTLLRKPKGIADIPEQGNRIQYHINELADKVIHIIEDKYRTEAKRKGFL